MNNFTFETQGTHTYLVYSVGDEVLDNMSVGMLTGNHINGFLTTAITQLDANKFIKYDVSAKLSAKEFLSGYVTRKRLIGVFSGVVRALFSAEEYMLDPASVLLDLDYMYSDVATGETWLICLPVINTDALPVQPANFFKSVISNIQCDPTENCDYFAKILNYLNGAAIFSLEDFGELLSALEKDVTPSPAYGSAPIGRVPQPAAPKVAPAAAPQAQSVQRPVAPQAQPAQPVQPAQAQRPVTPPPAQARPAAPVQPQRPVTPPPAPKAQPQANNATGEKDMSWLYLMQHYNAENAAAYKAQKDAKKNKGGAAPAPAQAAPTGDMGFAIPGQSAPAPQPAPKAAPAAPAQAQRPMTPPPAQARPAAPVQPQRPMTPPPAQARPAAPVQPQRPVTPPPAQARPAAPVQPAAPAMNFGETVVVDNSAMNGTVVIGAAVNQVKSPCLIRVKTKEKISLTKPVVRLGRARDFVDYCVHDNPAVSQSHANIFNRGGTCFIVDTNSTNHTYVNGTMISAGAEVQLNEGDKIRLGNEEFDFKLC